MITSTPNVAFIISCLRGARLYPAGPCGPSARHGPPGGADEDVAGEGSRGGNQSGRGSQVPLGGLRQNSSKLQHTAVGLDAGPHCLFSGQMNDSHWM